MRGIHQADLIALPYDQQFVTTMAWKDLGTFFVPNGDFYVYNCSGIVDTHGRCNARDFIPRSVHMKDSPKQNESSYMELETRDKTNKTKEATLMLGNITGLIINTNQMTQCTIHPTTKPLHGELRYHSVSNLQYQSDARALQWWRFMPTAISLGRWGSISMQDLLYIFTGKPLILYKFES